MALPVVTLFGNLGRDPEYRSTSNGNEVMSFSIAVNSRKGGEEKTQWVRVSQWNPRRTFTDHLKKGSFVAVTGELEIPSIYQDKNGNPQVSMDIRAFDGGVNFAGSRSQAGDTATPRQAPAGNDDVPF